MIQVYEHYEKWEDYKNGMYSKICNYDAHIKLIHSIGILTSKENFIDAANDVLIKWPISSAVNLTNKNQNRRAWLGAAACCLRCEAPEYITRMAWYVINEIHKIEANKIADKIILNYERENKSIHKNMGEQMLF